MRETVIQAHFCKIAKERTWLEDRFKDRAAPDRMFTTLYGSIIFVEFKAPKKKPTDAQQRDHTRRRTRQQRVHVVDSIEAADAVLELYRNA